jgi:hypothetical protein
MKFNKMMNEVKHRVSFLLEWIWHYTGLKNGANIFYHRRLRGLSLDLNLDRDNSNEFEAENVVDFHQDSIETDEYLTRWEEDGGYVEEGMEITST